MQGSTDITALAFRSSLWSRDAVTIEPAPRCDDRFDGGEALFGVGLGSAAGWIASSMKRRFRCNVEESAVESLPNGFKA